MNIREAQKILVSRLQRNITQAELGKALGIQRASASSRFKIGANLKFDDIKKIETYFNISLNHTETKEESVTLERISISPSCGNGTIVLDSAEVTPITLGTKLIQNVFKINDIKNLKVFTASGDSMESTIFDGDDVLVDIGNLDFKNGGIFVIEKFGDWFIKRLRLRLDGNLEIISDNNKYSTEVIKYDNDITINIKGRVIKNLSRGL